MAKLLSDLQASEANQVSVFASQKAQVDQLTSETQTALSSLDGRLTAAGEEIVHLMRSPHEMYTWTIGVKAEIEALRSGKGASGPVRAFGSDGKGSGGGIDKKEVAVWKLPEDVSKVQ